MLLNGQPIEFPPDMAGMEQDLGNGPVKLEPNGRGVETATHKYLVFDSGETSLYDLVADPDGINDIISDPSNSAIVEEMSSRLAKKSYYGKYDATKPI